MALAAPVASVAPAARAQVIHMADAVAHPAVAVGAAVVIRRLQQTAAVAAVPGAAEVMAVVEAEAAVCFAAGCQVSGCSRKEIRV